MMNTAPDLQIFRLNPSFRDPLRGKLFSVFRGSLERLLFFNQLNRMYAEIRKNDTSDFLKEVLDVLSVGYRLSDLDFSRIPRNGSVIVVANHPFGAIEGIVLASILCSARSDVKIMANYLLECIPELREMFFPVDPFGKRHSIDRNVKPLRETIRWLKGGHVLGVFPAGEVSHLQLRTRKVIDPEWNGTIARIVRKTEAPVLPVFFKGSNGALFQLLGLLHPRLRTVMLPHELLNKSYKKVEVRIGSLISFDKLKRFDSDTAMMEYLKVRTYLLENRGNGEGEGRKASFFPKKRGILPEPVIPPVASDLMVEEICALSPDQTLVETGDHLVFHAEAQQIYHVLREIGRLREVTFRQVGEGTGKSVDLDRFDDYYVHLFVWNRAKKEIVGAYRIGRTDEILDRYGRKGLYTSTLFRYKPELLKLVNPALELGRSFVRSEYQKTYSPLLLLWKGIGHFVSRNPQYQFLFGTVSINNEYHAASKHLMVSFLRRNNYTADLARFVKARTPLQNGRFRNRNFKVAPSLISDVEDLSALIADIESTQKGIPVLLRQYLKLGGKLLGFNVDPKFSNVLDGLILVDLTRAELRILERYMGKEGAESFMQYHQMVF